METLNYCVKVEYRKHSLPMLVSLNNEPKIVSQVEYQLIQSKLPYPAKAESLFQGTTFKLLKKLAMQNKFDYYILSGKYGLLAPNDWVKPYDQKIQNSKHDIERVQKSTLPKLKKLLPEYDLIIVFMSKTYTKVIEPLIDERFIIVFSKEGRPKYQKLLRMCLKFPNILVLKELNKYNINTNQAQKERTQRNTLERWVKMPHRGILLT